MLKELLEKRAALLKEAEALRDTQGGFPSDEVRASFDAMMKEIEALDVRILSAKEAEPRLTLANDDDVDAARNAATKAERTRIADITAAVRVAKLDSAVADRLVKDGKTIDEARGEVLRLLAESQESNDTRSGGSLQMGEDAHDKFLRGASNWMVQRSGMASMVAKYEDVKPSDYDPGEFRGMTLFDLARETLVRAGQTVRGVDRMELVARAFMYRSGNSQTTSDFAVLLENVMHKVLRAAYAITPDTWRQWCGTATVTDFRTHNWYRLGALGSLDDVNEAGEFKNKVIPDGEKATFVATTKGNIIAVSRQTIINDDMGALTRMTSMLGRAAALTIEKAAYALLGQNSGLGPTQSDSQPLFHSANRANVGAGAALSAAAIDADGAIMAAQQDPNSQEFLDLQPDVLLVPRGLRGTAITINEATFDPDTANKLQKPNAVRGFFRQVVATPRLSGTRRYMFASPSLAPIFVVSFLEGQTEPVLETQDGWRTDGVEMKGRLDFGVDDVDYRGAVTDAGV